jgi:hypothetical protein
MKPMGNRVVSKIMSIPIVMRIITVEMKAFMWVMSLFSRKKVDRTRSTSRAWESSSCPVEIEHPNITLDILSRVR